MKARSNCSSGVLLRFEKARWNDDIGVHGPYRNLHRLGDLFAPSLGLPQRILVAHYQCRPDVIEECPKAMERMATQDEPHTASVQTLPDVIEAIDEKLMMAEVGTCDERVEPEEHDDRLVQLVADGNRNVERRVVHRPLRALHPIHDGFAFWVGRAAPANGDARIGGESV